MATATTAPDTGDLSTEAAVLLLVRYVVLLGTLAALLPVLAVAMPLLAVWRRAHTPWWMAGALTVAVSGLTWELRQPTVDGYAEALRVGARVGIASALAASFSPLLAAGPAVALSFVPYALLAGPPLACLCHLLLTWHLPLPFLRPSALLGLPARPSAAAATTTPPPKGGAGATKTDGRTDDAGGTKHTNGNGNGGSPGAGGAWMTGEDFAVLAGKPAPTLWGDCLEEGSVTLAPGVPKAGKSELFAGLGGAIVSGAKTYLGWALNVLAGGEPIVVLCEETPQTYRHKALRMSGQSAVSLTRWARLTWPLRRRWGRLVRRAGRFVRRTKGPIPDIHVVSGPLVRNKGVDDIRGHLLAAAEKAFEVGGRLILVDSIKHWCKLAVTQDEAASILMEAAKEVAGMVNPKTKRGLIVVLLHHLSEKDGHMLGPTTLFSQADFRLSIGPPEGMKVTETALRVVTPEGRFPGMAPDGLLYQMVEEADGRTFLRGVTPGTSPSPGAARAPKAPPAEEKKEDETPPPPPAPPRNIKAEGRAAVVAWLASRADPAAWAPSPEIVEAQPGGLARTAVTDRLKELRETGEVEWQKAGKGLVYRVPTGGG